MTQAARRKFNEPLTIAIPRLMRVCETAPEVARALGVDRASVYGWLVKHDWKFVEGLWVAPEPEET